MFLETLLGLLSKTLSYLQKPIYSGNFSVASLEEQCKISTLSDGTIHITSKKESALWFGLGFVMARDRFWQLEWMRRIATGTLSEIIPEAEMSDRFARTLGFHRTQLQFEDIPPEELGYFQHFLNGINEFIKQCFHYSKPVEMTLLAMPKPKEWTIEDAICLQRMISFHFGKNPILKLVNVLLARSLIPSLELHNQRYQSGLGRFQQQYLSDLQRDLHTESQCSIHNSQSKLNDDNSKKTDSKVSPRRRKSEIDTSENIYNQNTFDSVSDGSVDVSISEEIFDFVKDLDWKSIETLSQCMASSIGDQCSTSIVINGDHTSSGKPIFACDVWGASSVPSLWYKCRITLANEDEVAPQDKVFDVNGFAIVGLPYLPIGHNHNVSWGITPAQFADTTDLYIEKVHSSDRSRYYSNGRWIYATTIDETIYVRGQKFPLEERVRVTRNGPILSNLFSCLQGDQFEISISNPSLREWDCIPVSGFRKFCKAKSADDIVTAANDMHYFPIVITFADTKNNTGWLLVEGTKQRRSMLESNFPLKGFTEDVYIPESCGKLFQIYPPTETSKALGGGIGRTFVIGTHSHPQSNYYQQVKHLYSDTYSFPTQEPFVGHSFKLPTRVQSIHAQLRTKLGEDGEELMPLIAKDHTTYRGKCEEIVRAMKVSNWNMLSTAEELITKDPAPIEWKNEEVKKSRISMDDVKSILTNPWVDPRRYIVLLTKLLNIEVSKSTFETVRAVYAFSEDITLDHIEESRKIMLNWDGSLESNSTGAIIVQIFFHELFKIIFTPLVTKKDCPILEPCELSLLSKVGYLDTISPVSYKGFDESYFELLLQLYPPSPDIIIKAITTMIGTLRGMKPRSKSLNGSQEMRQYSIGIAYKLQWKHYMDYEIVRGFNIQPKLSPGLFALDIESSISHPNEVCTNYLGLAPNVLMKPFQRHTTSCVRFVIDMNDPEGCEYLFGPGNSGCCGAPYYKNLVDSYSKNKFLAMHLPKGKDSLVLSPTRKVITSDEDERIELSIDQDEVKSEPIQLSSPIIDEQILPSPSKEEE